MDTSSRKLKKNNNNKLVDKENIKNTKRTSRSKDIQQANVSRIRNGSKTKSKMSEYKNQEKSERSAIKTPKYNQVLTPSDCYVWGINNDYRFGFDASSL